MEIKVLKKDLDMTNKEMIVLVNNLTDLEGKDAELEEVRNKNLGLKEKLISLLDVLYGCEECGRHEIYCECNYLNGSSDSIEKQAGTELGQAQLKLGFDSTLISFRFCFPRIDLVDLVLYV